VVGVSAHFLGHSALLVPNTNDREERKSTDVGPVEWVNVRVGAGFELVDNGELVIVVSELNRRSSDHEVGTNNSSRDHDCWLKKLEG